MIVDPTGQLDGQAIGANTASLLITYDIDYLAQVNVNASLGAGDSIHDLFLVDAPKTVREQLRQYRIAGRRSVRLLYFQYPSVCGYGGDDLDPTSRPPSPGNSLQQGTTNQVILRFSMQTQKGARGVPIAHPDPHGDF